MNVSADICIIPIGVGVSVSDYVTACQKVFIQAGLTPQLHANGTNVEGDWDKVMAALKRCQEAVHEMGAPRVSTTLRLDTRTDRQQAMREKVESVQRRLPKP